MALGLRAEVSGADSVAPDDAGRQRELIPSFPSKTFPNHYTIVTGLYPGHHGIVANSIKDPATGRRLTMSNRKEVQDPMWWGGEPIWVTIQKAGQLAAPFFWPGSEAPIMGQLARYWEPFDERVGANKKSTRYCSGSICRPISDLRS